MPNPTTQKTDPEMLKNLDLLLQLEVLKNEKDWDLIERTGMLLHLRAHGKRPEVQASPTPAKETVHEK